MSAGKPFTLSDFREATDRTLRRQFLALPPASLVIDDALDDDAEAALVDQLPRDRRAVLEQRCQEVADLACEQGLVLAVEEARGKRIDLLTGFTEEVGLLHQALWLRIHHPQIAEQVLTYLQIDRLPDRSWHATHCPMNLTPGADLATVERLERALKAYFREHERRGGACRVRPFVRAGRYVYPCKVEDYSSREDEFENEDDLVQRVHRPVFQVVFVYDPSGRLDVFCHGGHRKAMVLREIFGQVVLGVVLPKEAKPSATYDLEPMCQPAFQFPLPAGGTILSAAPVAVTRSTTAGTRNDVRVGRGEFASLYDAMLHTWPVSAKVAMVAGVTPLSATQADSMEIEVTYRLPSGKVRPKRIKIFRTRCALGQEGLDGEIRAMLRAAGIERVPAEAVA